MGLLILNLILVISLKERTKRMHPYLNSLKHKRLDESANLSRRSFSEDGKRINIEEATETSYIERNSLSFPF